MASTPSTPDRTALARIAEWANAEPGVTVAADGTITVAGGTPIVITVTGDEERVQLTHRHLETAVDAARVEAVRHNLPGRGSAVSGVVSAAGSSLELALTSTLYVDGLTRQAFVFAFNELVAATDRAVGPVPSAVVPAPPAVADHPAAQPAPAAAPAVEPVSPDSAPTMVLSAVWAPTHRVPDGGMKAWPKPDPAVEPIATLQARVELSIAEHRGDWARVVGSNGWTGWVDSRRLLPLAAASGGTAAVAAAGSGFPLGALGAAALIAAAFLPWFDSGGFSANSFDVALPFLWDLQASGDPALGFGIAGAGVLGLIALFLKGVPDGIRRLAGIVGLAATVLFAVQVHRGVGSTVSDTIDVLGIGGYIALAGALVLLVSPRGRVTGG